MRTASSSMGTQLFAVLVLFNVVDSTSILLKNTNYCGYLLGGDYDARRAQLLSPQWSELRTLDYCCYLHDICVDKSIVDNAISTQQFYEDQSRQLAGKKQEFASKFRDYLKHYMLKSRAVKDIFSCECDSQFLQCLRKKAFAPQCQVQEQIYMLTISALYDYINPVCWSPTNELLVK